MEGASGTLAVSESLALGLVLICNATHPLKDSRLIFQSGHHVNFWAISYSVPLGMGMAALICTASGKGYEALWFSCHDMCVETVCVQTWGGGCLAG